MAKSLIYEGPEDKSLRHENRPSTSNVEFNIILQRYKEAEREAVKRDAELINTEI